MEPARCWPRPSKLKAFIAQAKFLVGSRFHSIVAALSSGVPAVSLGWAHKYEQLAKDLGCEQLLHRASDDPSHLLGLVDDLLDNTKNDDMRGVLHQHAKQLKTKVEAIWEEVLPAIGLAASLQGGQDHPKASS